MATTVTCRWGKAAVTMDFTACTLPASLLAIFIGKENQKLSSSSIPRLLLAITRQLEILQWQRAALKHM